MSAGDTWDRRKVTSPSIVGVVLCVACAATAFAGEQAYRVATGESSNASLNRIDAERNVFFDTAGGETKLPAARLVHWGHLHDTADGTQVLLADGSIIVGSGVTMDDEHLIIEASTFGEPEGFNIAGTTRLPLNTVRAIIFRPPLAASHRDQLMQRISTSTAREDQLLLSNGDVVSGTFTKLARVEAEGGQPGPLAVTINTQAGPVEICPDKPAGQLMEKVTAMVFNPLLVRPTRPDGLHMLIGFRDGSRLYAARIEPKGNEQAEFTLIDGAKIASHPDLNVWNEIDYLQPLGGKTRYLTDLTPATGSYKQTPLLDLTWPLGINENVLGGRLRAGGSLYPRGLGMHANSRVAYALDKPYKWLQAELAIDESAGDRGSVTFVVATSSGGAYEVVYESPIIRGGQPPLSMNVDISGAKIIVLAVKSADRGTQLDRANWLNVRLIE